MGACFPGRWAGRCLANAKRVRQASRSSCSAATDTSHPHLIMLSAKVGEQVPAVARLRDARSAALPAVSGQARLRGCARRTWSRGQGYRLDPAQHVSGRSTARDRRFLGQPIDIHTVVPLVVEAHDLGRNLAEKSRLSLCDAMNVAAALLAGCRTLVSEDLQPRQTFDGQLAVRNPYRRSVAESGSRQARSPRSAASAGACQRAAFTSPHIPSTAPPAVPAPPAAPPATRCRRPAAAETRCAPGCARARGGWRARPAPG